METEVLSHRDSGERDGKRQEGSITPTTFGLRSELSSFKTDCFEIMALHSRSRFSDIQWFVPWQESHRVARTSF